MLYIPLIYVDEVKQSEAIFPQNYFKSSVETQSGVIVEINKTIL